VKVGGSLFDHPKLGPGLSRWLRDRTGDERFLLVPGGGPFAEAVREMHRTHGLSQEASHWLALGTLTVTAGLLRHLVPGHEVVDCHAFALADEGRPGALEHSWRVTTDAIAARVARVERADRIVLLKSVEMTPFTDWPDAHRRGWVDAAFAEAVGDLPVEAVNFRAWLDGG